MNIKINYGTGVATLPTAALGSIDRATKVDIKLLFLLCAEPYLLTGENREACIARMGERAGMSVPQVESSLAFWRGAGVLDLDEEVGNHAPAEPPQADEGSAPAPQAEEAAAAAPVAEQMPAVPVGSDRPTVTVTVTRAKSRMLDEIPNYTTDELDQFLSEQSEASVYLGECQAIWGGMFNTREYGLIIALVRDYGLSWDYVLTLLAYGSKYFKERDNQGKSLNFVYRMAVTLHKEGIVTDEALRQRFVEEERMRDFEHRLRAMFGLGERNLSPKEKKFFSTWRYEYKYDIEIIEMAYNITVDTKGSPQMNYINGILKHWYEDGLSTVEAIVARREQDSAAVRSAKEGKMTPDNARETVESILASEGADASKSAPRSTNMAQDIGILRRLMGLGNRMLTDGETAAFTKWRTEYGFRYELIYYAYQITLENRREYSLPYMDAILSKWHARKLTTMEEIKAFEQGFKQERDKARAKSKAPLNAPTQNSSFDTNEFFMAAVKRSFGEDFDPTIFEQ